MERADESAPRISWRTPSSEEEEESDDESDAFIVAGCDSQKSMEDIICVFVYFTNQKGVVENPKRRISAGTRKLDTI